MKRVVLFAGIVLLMFMRCESLHANNGNLVDLQLVLAVDVSRSVDTQEAFLQRRGYIDAMLDKDVIRAITSGPHGRIAVTYYEWAGHGLVAPVVDWMIIDGEESARVFARQLTLTPMHSGQYTSISGSILFAADLFDLSPYRSHRKIIDISGDGPNNNGPHILPARAEVASRGIGINGLPIMNRRPQSNGYPNLEDLDIYYEECVITGPGAFVIVAESFEDFGSAIRRKLILEIAGMQPVRPPQARYIPASAYDCLVGEKQLRKWILKQGFEP